MDFLRAKGCARRLGITTKTWYKWQELDPTFPKPVIKTPGYVVWREEDVAAYQQLLIEQNRSGSMPPPDEGKDKKVA